MKWFIKAKSLIIFIVSLFIFFGCGGGGGGYDGLEFSNTDEIEFPENSVLSGFDAFYDSEIIKPQAQRYIYEDDTIEDILFYIYSVGGLKVNLLRTNDNNLTGLKEYHDELKDNDKEQLCYYEDEYKCDSVYAGYNYDNGYIVYYNKWTVHMYSWVGKYSDVITDKFGYGLENNGERVSLSDIYGPNPHYTEIDIYNATSNPNFVWILYADSSLKDEIDEINSNPDLFKPRIYVYKYLDYEPNFDFLY